MKSSTGSPGVVTVVTATSSSALRVEFMPRPTGYASARVRILAMTIEDFRTADSGGRSRDFYMCSALTRLGELDVLTFRPHQAQAGVPATWTHECSSTTSQGVLRR